MYCFMFTYDSVSTGELICVWALKRILLLINLIEALPFIQFKQF